jgi:beta-N-acetylglucosaminidase
MTKWIRLSLVLILLVVQVQSSPLVVNAFELACAPNQYSVDRITAVDQFTNLACFNENQFAEALARMNSEAASAPNVVVRHTESPSPMKIVAADRAMAYSQNDTYLRLSTINVFANKELTARYTYINQSNPLYYYGTHIKTKANTDIIKPSDLSAHIEVNAANGYIDLVGLDIIPLIYVENRWLINYQTRLLDEIRNHRIFPNLTTYTVSDVTSTTRTGLVTVRQLSIRIDNALTASTNHHGFAPEWLPVGTYYSPNGIEFYTDIDLKNPVMVNGSVGRYYNYYQFLNLRSKTNYTGSELDAYFDFYFSVNRLDPDSSVMREAGQVFIDAQNTYGMNALMIYAMGIHESAYGRSNFAVNRNNLFGYNAFDSSPGSASFYPSVKAAVDQHMGLNLRYYLDANNLNATLGTSLFYGSHIGTKGAGIGTRYASDPFWSIKIAGFAFRIDRYLGFKDINHYQIGILNRSVSNFAFSSANLSTPIYSIDARAQNYPIIINGFVGAAYMSQSTNPINNGTLITSSTNGLVPYNWEESFVYFGSNQILLANQANTAPNVISTQDVLLTYVTNWDWQIDQLYIKGWSALRNTNMALGVVKHQLSVVNMKDETQVYTFDLSIATENYPLNLGNGLNYTRAWFEGLIDVSAIPEGNYRFNIVTSSGVTVGRAALANSTVDAPRAQIVNLNGYNYRFSFNNAQGMRYELSKEFGLSVENQSSLLPTRFNSTAYITQMGVSTNDRLSITGISYIQNVPFSSSTNVSHRLLLLSSAGVPSSFVLTSGSGVYDLSNSGVTYSHAWFYGENLDLSTLSNDTYRVFIITTSNGITDVVEVRDLLIRNNQSFDSQARRFTLNTLASVRRRYILTIEDLIPADDGIDPGEDQASATP